MKTKPYRLSAVVMLLVSTSLLVAGCGDSDHDHKDPQMGPEHHEDAEVGRSHTDGGHLQHMDAVRGWLKGELKDQYDQAVPVASEARIAEGQAVYLKTCSTCHGIGGKGDGPVAQALAQPPADFTDAAHSQYYSDAGRIHIIKKGVTGTAMVGWENILSAEEIEAVYAYVRSLRMDGGVGEASDSVGAYGCPMHPEITRSESGKCTICAMDLVLKEAAHEHGAHEH